MSVFINHPYTTDPLIIGYPEKYNELKFIYNLYFAIFQSTKNDILLHFHFVIMQTCFS